MATGRGEHKYDDRLRCFDESWLDDMASEFREIESRAQEMAAGITSQDSITAGLLAHEAGVLATDIGLRAGVAPVDPYLGPHILLLRNTRQNTVNDMHQADLLLGRYHGVRRHLEQALGFQRAQAGAGNGPAMASLERVLSQLEGYLGSDLADDPFLALELAEAPDAQEWRERAIDAVRSVVRPAFQDYMEGLRAHLAPDARPDDECGLAWTARGEEIYDALIHKYTQSGMSPRQIHDIGQEWATEINASEWVEIGGEPLGASDMDEVFARLRADPGLRFESEEEMLDHARDAVERAWAEVDDWFGLRPETPCDVVPVPRSVAAASPPAYYMQPPLDGSRPGTYFLNTHRPEERDKFEYESIHFHEAIPGHHFDRSLASELDGLPTFRRYSQVYAHTEGWGLYAERLADEMGLYSSHVDRLGMVSADAWRAGRLVTDTGIHHLGWSRRQAIEFLEKWTPIGQLTIHQEVDRYIGMPAQALAYKLGQLEILRLRAGAAESLGSGFEIKRFHDEVLGRGALPLPMLTEVVESWVSAEVNGGD